MVVVVASRVGCDNRINAKHGARVPSFCDGSSRASGTSGLIFTAPISNEIQHTLHDSWRTSDRFWPRHQFANSALAFLFVVVLVVIPGFLMAF